MENGLKPETLSPQGARLEVPRLSMSPVRLVLSAWAQRGVSQIRGVMVGEGGGDTCRVRAWPAEEVSS